MDETLLPLFPLEVVLLPEQLLPLHIFEERYKEMLRECLQAASSSSGQKEFGVVLAKEGEVSMLGCSARIVNVTRKYKDGRMDILAVGKRRFEVLLTNEEKTYLRGLVEFFEDDAGADTPGDEDAERAIEMFRQAMQRLRQSPEILIHLPRPYRHLSFRIAGPLPLDLTFKQQLLSMRNEPERLRLVTSTTENLIRQFDLLRKAQTVAGGNGDLQPEN